MRVYPVDASIVGGDSGIPHCLHSVMFPSYHGKVDRAVRNDLANTIMFTCPRNEDSSRPNKGELYKYNADSSTMQERIHDVDLPKIPPSSELKTKTEYPRKNFDTKTAHLEEQQSDYK